MRMGKNERARVLTYYKFALFYSSSFSLYRTLFIEGTPNFGDGIELLLLLLSFLFTSIFFFCILFDRYAACAMLLTLLLSVRFGCIVVNVLGALAFCFVAVFLLFFLFAFRC